MLDSWIWKGESDTITLEQIREAGVSNIVATLDNTNKTTLWTPSEITNYSKQLKENNFNWVGFEHLSLNEVIKFSPDSPSGKKYISSYKKTLKNLAKAGVKVVSFSFQPLRQRSDLDDIALEKIIAFDLFLLKRKEAETSYSKSQIEQASQFFSQLNKQSRLALWDEITRHFIGYTTSAEEFRMLFREYQRINSQTLFSNLYYFLGEIIPVCEKTNLRLAICPDSSPKRNMLGLPCCLNSLTEVKQLARDFSHTQLGFSICPTTSLDSPQAHFSQQILEKLSNRILYVRFPHNDEGIPKLADHVEIIRLLKIEEQRRRDEGQFNNEIIAQLGHGKRMIMRVASMGGILSALKSTRPLVGKVAIVTGATGQIGATMVKTLLRAGAKVALLARTKKNLLLLQKSFADEDLPETIILPADVLNANSLDAAAKKLINHWGRLDILINCVSGNDISGRTKAEVFLESTPFEETFFGMDSKGFSDVLNLNIQGTIQSCHVFGKYLIPFRGNIVNISSVSSFQAHTKIGAYSSGKAAINNFTIWLSTHLAQLGIRVNAIAPGFFISNQNRDLLMESDGVTPNLRGCKVLATTAMKRFGRPEELASALEFLVSERSSFVTGIILPVDGGFLAYSGV